MKVFIVVLAVVAAVHGGSVRRVRQSGPGWGTPTTAPGWSGPPPSGWSAPSSTVIDLNAALAAAGSGWAGEQHSDNVLVTGAGGWGGPNAELTIVSGGESLLDQAGTILQITDQDAENAASINVVSVGQIAEAAEGQYLDATGLEISNAQSGWSAASGEGASAADATSSLIVNPAGTLGMAKP